MPTARGADWEKFNKRFGDDDEPVKHIAPLTDEYAFRERMADVRKETEHLYLSWSAACSDTELLETTYVPVKVNHIVCGGGLVF